MTTKIPPKLRAGIAAVLIATGGGAVYQSNTRDTHELLRNQFVQAVAQDNGTSMAVKIAMVMGAYYESSYKHIGTPYVDRLGKGQPLTVCNGLTGEGVTAGRYYTPADCYRLERKKYIGYERYLQSDLPRWAQYNDFQRATLLDFLHNKGEGKFATSTMRRLAIAGDIVRACRQNVRWNKGTVSGVSTILPGLQLRGDANAELCEKGLI